MHKQLILVLDEGTTSTRAILYAPDGAVVEKCQVELAQYYPAAGWVEHDALEIRDSSIACAKAMVERAGGAEHIAAIGITNQRETIVAWDRSTGLPICRAIIWQDRRTASRCDALRSAGLETLVTQRTGLVIDPYFSATKIAWILDNVPGARELGDRLAVGTVECWLVWSLTGGAHVSDASNASRTMLMDIRTGQWDDELLAMHNIPRGVLPEIVDCAGNFGTTSPEIFGRAIPICGLAGDQQAAAIGQACLSPGQAKATLGTGAFILCNTGERPIESRHRLLGTVLFQLEGKRTYALEGSIFVAGSLVQWLRDKLGIISDAAETEALARSVVDSGGVAIIPALSGLGAPHWRADARGIIAGLSHATGRAEIVRAALEAIAHQLYDLKRAYAGDGCDWHALCIDGGMSSNDWIAQDLADMLRLTVERPHDVETTARGAAMLAGLGCGLFASLDEAALMQNDKMSFHPCDAMELGSARLDQWHAVVGRNYPVPAN